MSPGDTSEVFGQVRAPTTCLEISKEKEVSDLIHRLRLGVGAGDTSEVFGQVRTPTTCLVTLECVECL